MRLRNFSLSRLFGAVTVAGTTAAALAYTSIYWASLFFSMALLGCAIGLLGAVYRKGQQRAFWTGFTVLGIGYFVLLYAPTCDRLIGQRLITTKVLGYLEPKIRRTDNVLEGIFEFVPASAATSPVAEGLITISVGTAERPFCPQWGHFQLVGHSLFGMLLALFGGTVAQQFHARDALHA